LSNRFSGVEIPTDGNIVPIHGVFNDNLITTGSTANATATETVRTTGRRELIVWNNDPSVYVYLGDSAVSAGNGFPLLPKTFKGFALGQDNSLYTVCSSGNTAAIRLVELL